MRFYLSKFVDYGPDADADLGVAHIYVAAINDLQASEWGFMDGRADYAAVNEWCLVWSDNTDAEHAALIVDSRIKYIPLENDAGEPLPVTAQLSEVNAAKLVAIKTSLENHHIPTDGLTLQNTISEAVELIIRRFKLRQWLRGDDFTEHLDLLVSDIPASKRLRIKDRLADIGIDASDITGEMTVRTAIKTLVGRYGR